MKIQRSIISWVLAVCIMVGMYAVPAIAENTEADTIPLSEYLNAEVDYSDYVESVSIAAKPDTEVIAKTESDYIHLKSVGDKATFTANVAESGVYGIRIDYRSASDEYTLSPIEVDVVIDEGKVPEYEWLKQLSLERIWSDAEEIRVDAAGNDIAPAQKEINKKNSIYLTDTYGQNLEYYLEAGIHTVSVISLRGEIEVYSVAFANEAEIPSYSQVSAEYSSQQASDYLQKIEAEDYIKKSSASIMPECDPANAATTPNDPVVQKLNYIAGSKFKQIGSWIEWEMEVPNDGVYYISLRSRQNYNSGMSSVRKLMIDGQVPFYECNEISFYYSGSWNINDIGDGKVAYGFYLKKGKHTLRLTSAYGSIYEAVALAENIVVQLNNLYNSVIMKIGSNPDKYRDYKLKDEIKGIKETLDSIYGDVKLLTEKVTGTNKGKSGSAVATLQSISSMLLSFIKNPDKIALNMGTFKNNTESLAAWANNLSEQPLDIDAIWVRSQGSNAPKEDVPFFTRLTFDVRRLLASFFSEYSIKDSSVNKNNITVWANVGRDQLKVLKPLTNSGFCSKYNAKVNLAINTDVSAAILAGVGPDICIFLDAGSPANLAVRNVLLDLSQFEDFETIASRFDENLLIPFKSVGGCVALPLSVSWPMMFVRNDILEKLKLTVPKTWQDMYSVAAVLQRNHLEIGIPSHVGMFFTLLFQNGGKIFDSNLETTFDDQASLNAFTTWSSFFSQYSFPLSYDFFNRFRSGEMPIGIADYTLYAQIKAAAPEIRGQWSMYQIPGTIGEGGQLNSNFGISTATGTVAAQGLSQGLTSAVIFSDTKNQELSWEFLKWFTSDSVQTDYGLGVEAELGYYGRYAAANDGALKAMPWSAKELETLESAKKDMILIDEYPGNYYIAREVNNAFRSVVNNGTNPADILSRKNVLINKELIRKYKQFDIKRGEDK